MNYITIEGAKISSRFLQVYKQTDVGTEGYDAGAAVLFEYFKRELPKYLTPELKAPGKKIIEACLSGAGVEEYNSILPMNYQYSFLSIKDFEEEG